MNIMVKYWIIYGIAKLKTKVLEMQYAKEFFEEVKWYKYLVVESTFSQMQHYNDTGDKGTDPNHAEPGDDDVLAGEDDQLGVPLVRLVSRVGDHI